jgi:F0F1-type ATP synthase epsilon subunit
MANELFYKEEFKLLIRDKQRVLFQGNASAVSTKNANGLLDILPEHINFISLVKDFIHVMKIDGTKSEFAIDMGIVKVYQNEVHVYLGIFSTSSKK